MKKLLFTLSALLVGFAASAFNLEMRLVDNEGNPCSEIHAKAGDRVTMHMQVTALDGIVAGAQFQYYMQDVNGENMDPTNGVVVLRKQGANYIRPEGMSTLLGNGSSNNVNPADGPNAYRIVCANTTYNTFWIASSAQMAARLEVDEADLWEAYWGSDGQSAFTPAMFVMGNVFTFTVQVKDGWEDEYAIFDFDEVFTKFSGLQNQQIADEGMSLKIINDDYAAPVTLANPVITFTDVDATHVTVTVTCETEGATLYLNGEAYNGPVTMVREGDIYTPETLTVNAKATLGDQETTASNSYVWPVENQPTADAPVITFAETKNANEEVTAVTVQITNWTSATINGETINNTRDDVKTFTANYVADQPIHVEAVNAPGYPYIASATVEDDYNLKKLASTASEAATFGVTMDDEYVYVTAMGPGVVLYDQNGNVVDPQPLKLPRNEYSETSTGYTVNIHATTQQQGEPGQYTQTDTPYEVTVPNKAKPDDPQPTEKTPTPTASGRTPDGVHAYYVTITDLNPNAVIYYRVYKDGVLLTEGEDGWVVYDGEFGYTEDGSYRVEMYAVAPGMLPSDQIAYEFVISETTGLVDVMNGKTVSNVRYFNMAGQEMQEANGMTIVVTTYTDGTSSAVKVMK